MAQFFTSRGRYPAAEEYYRRAIAIFEKSLGPDDLLVAATLEGNAELMWQEKRFGQARHDIERAITIREKKPGQDRAVAVNLNNLAFFYVKELRYSEAEPIALRASALLERTTGPDYPDVAANLQILGRIRKAQGRYREAEPLLKRSLDIRNAAMGLVTSAK